MALGVVAVLVGSSDAGAQTQPKVTRGHYSSLIQGSELIGTDFSEIQVFRSLPAGNYIANASAVIISSDPERRFVDCMFTIDGEIRGEPARGTIGGGHDTRITMSLTIAFVLESPHDLGLACITDVSGTVFSQTSPISVIRVDTLRVKGFRIVEE